MGRLEALDFRDGEFTGEDGALHGENGFEESESFGGGDRHLGGCVELDARHDFAGHFCEAEILDDQGIDTGGGDEAELPFGCFKLIRKYEGVHRDKAFHSVLVEVGHQLRQIFLTEIVGSEAGVEFRQAEVDRIGACGDGGFRAVPVACGREQFGFGVRLFVQEMRKVGDPNVLRNRDGFPGFGIG